MSTYRRSIQFYLLVSFNHHRTNIAKNSIELLNERKRNETDGKVETSSSSLRQDTRRQDEEENQPFTGGGLKKVSALLAQPSSFGGVGGRGKKQKCCKSGKLEEEKTLRFAGACAWRTSLSLSLSSSLSIISLSLSVCLSGFTSR